MCMEFPRGPHTGVSVIRRNIALYSVRLRNLGLGVELHRRSLSGGRGHVLTTAQSGVACPPGLGRCGDCEVGRVGLVLLYPIRAATPAWWRMPQSHNHLVDGKITVYIWIFLECIKL